MFKTEIETFLCLPQVADFISVAVEISCDDYKKLSDFERFSLICEKSDMLLGSDIIKHFFDLVKTYAGTEITAKSLKRRDVQNRAWRVIHGDVSVNLKAVFESENQSVDYYRSYTDLEYIDVIDFIFKGAQKEHLTFDDFLERLYASDVNSFFVTLDNFEYLRPNEYQARVIYQKLSSDEKCKKREIGLLVSHIICCLGKKKKCHFRLLTESVNFEFEGLADLFEKRNSDIEINVCFNAFVFDFASTIFDLMLKKGKKISSEIIIPEDADIESVCKCLMRLLKTIPFSRIAPAYADSRIKFESAVEIIRKNQLI